jgi:hypothetical protein
MSIQNLIIYQFPSFYKIFKEIENEFNFNIIEAIDNKTLKSVTTVSDNYIIISKKNYSNIATQLIIEKFPISIFKIIERINIEFLKKNFNDQSQIKVKDYKIDINSRQIFLENKQLKLWGYQSDLETHTVETHIYRLRKKFLDLFGDDKFIISIKNGYKI